MNKKEGKWGPRQRGLSFSSGLYFVWVNSLMPHFNRNAYFLSLFLRRCLSVNIGRFPRTFFFFFCVPTPTPSQGVLSCLRNYMVSHLCFSYFITKLPILFANNVIMFTVPRLWLFHSSPSSSFFSFFSSYYSILYLLFCFQHYINMVIHTIQYTHSFEFHSWLINLMLLKFGGKL